jgi:molecular chaperone DnaK (HSP70)
MAGARYVVGIDLGTTHTVVASAPLSALDQRGVTPDILQIPQLVTAREEEARPLLPSCLYAPLPGEIVGDPTWVSGELARRRGAEIRGRFVSSAKSWLCHAGVDRLAAILPWGVHDEEGAPPTPRISPLDASTHYLTVVRKAWDRQHPEAPLASQEVFLTIPASFDEVARELTSKAAKLAGLDITLVEEPTAAFYDAMRDARGKDRSNTAWDRLLGRIGKKDAAEGVDEQFVLVCDVGGGTTDLSLMAIGARKKGEPVNIRRVAVGRHILLGGDNMDLALAHVCESRMSLTEPLPPGELAQLVLSCRDAKERIFGGAREAKVTVLGRGGKLVASQKSVTLTKKDLREILVQGFFPIVLPDEPAPKARTGLVSFGLPYERNPEITRHVLSFLVRHKDEMHGRGPDALLLNGGVFHAEVLAEAIGKQVEVAFGREPSLLPNAEPDLAVARGAVLYGFARRGHGVRVTSGASHGYYVAIESEGAELRAVCILPRGADEGEYFEAEGRSFELTTGRTVKFPLYASDVRRDSVGALVKVPALPDASASAENEESDAAFQRLPPLVLNVPSEKKGEGRVPVTLGGVLTPTGQLELFCTKKDGTGGRIRLEFQLREGAGQERAPVGASLPPASLAPAPSLRGASVGDPRQKEARALVDKVFGKRGDADPRATKDLVRELERVLGDRAGWTMEVTRTLADQLLENPGARRRSAHHERVFFMLAGFCLRPGFGDPGDVERVRVFSTLFEGRLAFPDEARGWQQFFIAWRRVSGGLAEAQQLAIRDAFDPVIAPKEANLKKPKRIPEGQDELCMMLASLERVPVARRVDLGEWLIERTWVDKDPRLWTAIGRIGARAPLYASLHHVVAPRAAEAWLTRLLRETWGPTLPTAAHAAVQLARVTGDRARDLSSELRAQTEKKLAAAGAKEEWLRAVRELIVMGEAEKVEIMGEGLPIGLRLSE